MRYSRRSRSCERIVNGIADTGQNQRVAVNGVTRLSRNDLYPDTRSLRRVVLNSYLHPSERTDYFTVDIFPFVLVTRQRIVNRVYQRKGIRTVFSQYSRCIVLVLAPVLYVQTDSCIVGNTPRLQVNQIVSCLAGRVHITVLPVERHRTVDTVCTGNLRRTDIYLQRLVGQDTEVCRYRVGRQVLTQLLVDKGFSSALYREINLCFLECFINQLLQTLPVVRTALEGTGTLRNLEGQRVLPCRDNFYFRIRRSGIIQINVASGIRIGVVVADIRNTDSIPCFFIGRNRIFYVRYCQRSGIFHYNRRSQWSIVAELNRQLHRLSRNHFHADLSICSAINSVCRETARYMLAGTYTLVTFVFLSGEYLNQVLLRSILINPNLNRSVTAKVLGVNMYALAVQRLVLLPNTRINEIPDGIIRALLINRILRHYTYGAVAAATVIRIYQFRPEPERTLCFHMHIYLLLFGDGLHDSVVNQTHLRLVRGESLAGTEHIRLIHRTCIVRLSRHLIGRAGEILYV